MEYIELFTTMVGIIIIGLLSAVMLLAEALEKADHDRTQLIQENKKLKRKYDGVQNTRRLEQRR